MFPFASLLGGTSVELRVPGQDSLYTVSNVSAWPDNPSAGLRFNSDGRCRREQNLSYTTITDMWIHSDMWDIVDGSLYEFRYTSATGDTAFITPGLVEDTWYELSSDRQVSVYSQTTEFGPSVNKTVDMIVQVREKANHSNIRSGNVRFSATAESLA